MHWIHLGIAILAEVIATSALRAADGFTRLWPSITVVIGYALAFYFVSLTVRAIPLGLAYSVWSGVGTALVLLIGRYFYGQVLDGPALIGIALIIAGVAVIYLFSKAQAQ